MATPRRLPKDEALQTYWEEAAYTHAALLANPLSKDLAKPWKLLLVELEKLIAGQRACWLKEIEVQAQCEQVNLCLDRFSEKFIITKVNELREKHNLRKENDAKASSEFTYYFGSRRPYELIRLAPESKIPRMELWPRRLSEEASEDLKGYGLSLRVLLDEGKQVIKARTEARAETSAHRIDQIEKFVERMNEQRLETCTSLSQIRDTNKLDKDWPEAFFAKAAKPAITKKQDAKGKIYAILGVLAARKIEVSEEERQRISSTFAPKILDKWIAAVAFVSQTSQLFVD